MTALVRVKDLEVCGDGGPIVEGVSFEVAPGEVLALIGESGSGKTTIALALMGHVRGGCRITAGSVRFQDQELVGETAQALEALRGARIAYIAQSAAAAFNPARTLMDQVIEPALSHGLFTRRVAETKAVELFRALGLPGPETIGSRYPHQVSGGQLQRLMAAMALITDPALVILDEPTTALDVTTQIEALRVFKQVVRERGVTAVYVSHDLAVVAQMADRILVMKQGQVREVGSAAQVLHAPANDYTQVLVAAAGHSRGVERAVVVAERPMLEVTGVTASYGHGRAPVLEDVSFSVPRGAAVGVIGESGSGKSTLARVIAGLVSSSAGDVRLDGERLSGSLRGRSLDQLRRIQIVFQNADTALNPAHNVGRVLGRPLELYEHLRGAARERRVSELLELIRLPAGFAARSCGELSGGQKQRINLARALAAKPDVLLCDEVTSALDTVVATAMLELLGELRRELGLSLVFISHDISTVRELCDEVVVLYGGRVVEHAPSQAFGAPPHHPYTDLLLASVPEMRQGWLEESRAAARDAGFPADPQLCRFLPRCPVRIAGACDREAPPLREMERRLQVLCHHTEAELAALQAAPPTLAEARR